eukprot:15067486-Alexandrium_andersonii.AAC.1
MRSASANILTLAFHARSNSSYSTCRNPGGPRRVFLSRSSLTSMPLRAAATSFVPKHVASKVYWVAS